MLCFEKEKENEISFELGLAPHFAAHQRVGSACSPCTPPRLLPRAAWRPYAIDAGRVASGGPRARLKPLSERPINPTPPLLHPLTSGSSRGHAGKLRHRTHARPRRSKLFQPPPFTASCYISPRTPPPPRHPALASVSRGKAPFNGNRSPEHGRAHRRAPLPWTPPLPLSFHAHEHRTVSRLLLGTSIYHAVAGNAPPATTRAAAPPCTAVASLPSSTDHRTYTKRFAG
jgi:hypothetical protein